MTPREHVSAAIHDFECGFEEEAEARLRRILREIPDHLTSLYLLPKVLQAGGRPAEAVPLYRRLLDILRSEEGYMDDLRSKANEGLLTALAALRDYDAAGDVLRERIGHL